MGTSGIQKASFEEAQRLGHDWAGPEHGLLAILRGDPQDVARTALEEAGMDSAMVERQLDEMSTPGSEKRQGVTSNPAWHGVFGRAEGFAGALGTGEVQPVHLLLAFLWDDRLWQFAERQGITREGVVEALRRAGVALPSAPMPDLERPWKNGHRVDFPISALDRVIALLIERHPPGTEFRWGINHDAAEKAWAYAEEGIDLHGIVEEALADEGNPSSEER